LQFGDFTSGRQTEADAEWQRKTSTTTRRLVSAEAKGQELDAKVEGTAGAIRYNLIKKTKKKPVVDLVMISRNVLFGAVLLVE
jgi:hypothetical protein